MVVKQEMHYGVTIAAVVHRKSLNAQSHFKKRTSLFLFLSLEKKVKKMICFLHIPEISAVFFFFCCQLFRFHSSVPPSLSLAINIHPKIHAYILFFSFPLRPLGKKKKHVLKIGYLPPFTVSHTSHVD